MRIRWLAIFAILVLVELATSSQVSASSSTAIVVYDHGFVTNVVWAPNGNFNPVNRTSTFTQDAPIIAAYLTASLYSANLTWLWYDPFGQLYLNNTHREQCSTSPCTLIDVIGIAGQRAATRFGEWSVDLLAGGSRLYTDYFWLTPITTQYNQWNFDVIRSDPFRGHCNLTVVIHPDNLTWTSYQISLPYAANLTAHELATNRPLEVTANKDKFVVSFGAAQSDGYTFVLSFDLWYGIRVNKWTGGDFAFIWQDQPWQRTWVDGFHPIPESFSISLPTGSRLVDLIGINVMVLNWNVTSGDRPSVSFTTILPPRQEFGWTLLYQDPIWLSSHFNSVASPTVVGTIYGSQQLIPAVPLTVGSLSLWSAIMSVFLVTASELLSPFYDRTGIVINRRRLQYVALVLVVIFLVTTAYQIILSQSLVHSLR